MLPIKTPICFLPIALLLYVPMALSSDLETPAGTAPESSLPYKLTLGSYRFSSGANALDINARHTSSLGNVWLGYYESRAREEQQWRVGWDHTFAVGEARLSPSLQFASQGFAAFSAQVETGESWFIGTGVGRTNLRPYWNLNFDPNDSYTLSAGRRQENGESISLQWVRDNRQNPDQRHLHLVYRTPRPGGERVTFDLLYKQGMVDDVLIQRWGVSLAYDWPKLFARVAYDPKVNFTSDDMWRIAVGARF